MGSFTGTFLHMLIHKMAEGEFDFIYWIVGVVVAFLIIVVLYRLCCYKNSPVRAEMV